MEAENKRGLIEMPSQAACRAASSPRGVSEIKERR